MLLISSNKYFLKIPIHLLLGIIFLLIGSIKSQNLNAPFYTGKKKHINIEQFAFGSSGSNSQSATFTYNGWHFSSAMSQIPNNYVLLSFSSIAVASSNGGAMRFTFNITNQIIRQT
jgi:hypothetical protein